jgi:hypothetical protein
MPRPCDRCQEEDASEWTLNMNGDVEQYSLCVECRHHYHHYLVRRTYSRDESDEEEERVEEEDDYEVEDPTSSEVEDAEADGSGDPE